MPSSLRSSPRQRKTTTSATENSWPSSSHLSSGSIGWRGSTTIYCIEHKNLEYLWEAKRLHSRQARWGLFTTRLNFSISYHPCTKYVKAEEPEPMDLPPFLWSVIYFPSHAICFFSKASLPWWKQQNTSSIMSSDSFRSQHCIRHGPQLISKVWKAFFTRLIVSLSFGYHPQSTGQTERKIQQIGCFLQTFCHSHQDTPAQLGAQSQIHWPLHHHQTDKPNHPTVATPLILQDSSLFPCFTP